VISDVKTGIEMISRIRARDPKTLALVYKETFPMVLKHVVSNNGSKQDAQDVFQDAFYLLIQKANDPEFELTSLVSTYLVGVSKNLWLKKLTRTNIDPALYTTELLLNEAEIEPAQEEQLARAKHMTESLNALGEPCKTLLVQYYYFRQTMKEIAVMLHYTNPENAKNQKYKCLQRLKKMVAKSNG
jgi:RNA polymerase sigma factor (sigma-70 family)